MENHDVLIIGAGPAGCAAAVQCKKLGLNPLLLDKKGRAGGLIVNASCIENYPGIKPVNGPSFVKLLNEYLKRFLVDVKKENIKKVTLKNNIFVVSGEKINYNSKSVILATGTNPVKLSISGAKSLEDKNLFYEFYDLREKICLKESISVVVIGSGEAALDYSVSIAQLGAKATIAVRSDRLKAEGWLREKVKSKKRIKILYNCRINRLVASNGEIIAHHENGKIKCDAILAAIGRHSFVNEILLGLDLMEFSDISTSYPGLFVTGDARFGSLGQAGMAVGDGLEAAMAAKAFCSV